MILKCKLLIFSSFFLFVKIWYHLSKFIHNKIRLEEYKLKSTGVVRRIDDLGRIVIPKEIRRNLKIREGENMEIFIDVDSIILKKYSKLEDIISYTDKLGKLIFELTEYNILITDREHIISAHGNNFKNLKNEVISDELINIIDERRSIMEKDKKVIEITSALKIEGYFLAFPIISIADSVGLILLHSEGVIKEGIQILLKMVARIISEQVDIN